ncbi:MAG: SpoVG family protein [Candidatus Babeliales bacterium]
MEITEVKVYPVRDTGRLKGYATFVIGSSGEPNLRIIVRDVKIIEGEKGLFISMPSRKKQDGSFRDIVHPLNAETRTLIEKMVVEEFDKLEKAPSK